MDVKYGSPKVNERGYWTSNTKQQFDKGLCPKLVEFFEKEGSPSVCDLGCGCQGRYTLSMIKEGIDCHGFDGNPHTPEITNEACRVRDLTKDYDDAYDWILCLEVGEHIPQIYEKAFIKNIDKNNKKGIILSWAVEGQGGEGHVNERNNNYIKELFLNLGYINDTQSEKSLRESCDFPWLKNTIMVFRKNIKIALGVLTHVDNHLRQKECLDTWLGEALKHEEILPVFYLGLEDIIFERYFFSKVGEINTLFCNLSRAEVKTGKRGKIRHSKPNYIKTYYFLKWAIENIEFDYIFKCDDDTYVDINKLLSYDFQNRDYVGFNMKYCLGDRFNKGKWLNYASGGAGYFLSKKAASIVVEEFDFSKDIIKTSEDATVGQVLSRNSIKLHNEPRLFPACKRFFDKGGGFPFDIKPMTISHDENDLITSHFVSGMMKDIHKMCNY